MCVCVHADPFDEAECWRYSTNPAHHSHKGEQKSTWVTEDDYNLWRLGDPEAQQLGKGNDGHWQIRLTPHMVKTLNSMKPPCGAQPGQRMHLFRMLNYQKLASFRKTVSDFETVVVDHRNCNLDCNRSDINGMPSTRSVSKPTTIMFYVSYGRLAWVIFVLSTILCCCYVERMHSSP